MITIKSNFYKNYSHKKIFSSKKALYTNNNNIQFKEEININNFNKNEYK